MGKIYCLMGKSASGKDTVYRKILERLPELGTYVMYTTRPMREGEIPGRTYHYIEAGELDALSRQGKVIESRTYSTVYGPWTYATVDDGQFDLESGDYLVPGTPESFVRLKAYSERTAWCPCCWKWRTGNASCGQSEGSREKPDRNMRSSAAVFWQTLPIFRRKNFGKPAFPADLSMRIRTAARQRSRKRSVPAAEMQSEDFRDCTRVKKDEWI